MKDIVVAQKYNKDGEEKTSWQKIGIMGENKKWNQWVKINVVPVNWDGFANVFENNQDGESNNAPKNANDNENMPF